MAEYVHPEGLVSTGWVAGRSNDPGIRIVEVDVDTKAYDEGHVAGAIAWAWNTQLADQVRRDILSASQLEDLMALSGISDETTVVIYGDSNNWFAAWAFWQMKIYGHKDVRLMNGGRKKWISEGRDLTTDEPIVKRAVYHASQPDLSLRAFLPQMQHTHAALVDGLPETCQRGGHIPGARNIPWGKACNDYGTFKSRDELRELYGTAGIGGAKPVISYRRIGERSSHTWFVLKYLLGFENVSNYDGSWIEWGNRRARGERSGGLKIDYYRERKVEVGGWQVNLTSCKLGEVYHCTSDNVSAGATLARTTGATREDAEQKAPDRATQLLARTKRHDVSGQLVLLLAVLLLTPAAIRAQTPNGALQKVFADYYEFSLRDSPSSATAAGRTEYNDRWRDPSPEAAVDRRRSLEEFRRRLGPFRNASLNDQDRLSLRLLDWQLNEQVEEITTISTYDAINHFRGGHLLVFSTIAISPSTRAKDYENIIARLRALPKWADGTIAAANLAITNKKVQPRLVAELTAKQLEAEMSPDALKSPLLKAFTKFPASIPKAEQDRLQAAAVEAYNNSFRPAWRKLHEYLTAVYIPAARDSIGLSQAFNGAEMYALQVRRMTTTNYTPQRIHEIGLKEVARIRDEMAAIRKELNFTGSASEFNDKVLNGPEFRFRSEREILAHGRDIAKRIDPELPRLFRKLPRMPYGVQAIPADRARTDAPHYVGPSLDGSRAGNFFLRTVDPEKESNCCMESLILHEAVPGHHLQIALAQEMEGVPEFRKVTRFTAFIEGWGLYAETLGSALNMYETPYERYGQLQTEIFRATRLVVDTGMHALGWSREKAIETMEASGGVTSHGFLLSEIDRYIAMPAQALAYKMGELKIQEMRRLAEKELGPRFDVREFHDVVLRNGALPLDILEEQVRAWLAAMTR